MRIFVLLLVGLVVPVLAEDENPLTQPRMEDLRSEFPSVRRQAVVALGRRGDRSAVPALIAMLQDPDSSVRREAARVLGQWKDEQAVPRLIQSLGDGDANVRTYAAYALGEIKDPRARDALLGALSDPQWTVRDQAAWAIRELRDPQLAAKLVDLLNQPQTDTKAVMWLLEHIAPEDSFDHFVRLLGASRTGCEKMGLAPSGNGENPGKSAVAEVPVPISSQPRTAVRLHAVRALAAAKDPRVFDALLGALDDAEPAVRLAAAEALADSADKRKPTIFRELLAAERRTDVAWPDEKGTGTTSDSGCTEATIQDVVEKVPFFIRPDVASILQGALDRMSPVRSLAAWWSFDDRDTKVARDMTGNGNEGQIRGCEPVEGRIGAALRFGPGRFIELGQPPKLPIANQPFTIMAWARPEADDGVVVARGGAYCGFSLYVKDGVAKFGIQRTQETPGSIAAGDRRVVGDWVHLAGVVHEDRIELYVDGRLAATKKTDGLIPGNCGQGMEIGFDAGNSPAEITDSFSGVLDEVKFFHAALSAEDIAAVKDRQRND
jgi:HEAT repeat protein